MRPPARLSYKASSSLVWSSAGLRYCRALASRINCNAACPSITFCSVASVAVPLCLLWGRRCYALLAGASVFMRT